LRTSGKLSELEQSTSAAAFTIRLWAWGGVVSRRLTLFGRGQRVEWFSVRASPGGWPWRQPV